MVQSSCRCTPQRALLLQPVFGSQEEWSHKTCHQSKAAQSVAGDTVLQDGGYLYPTRIPESQGLMVKVDLNLLTSSSQFILNINFMVGGNCYEFTCLPFGLSCAPWTIITKVKKPPMGLLRAWGISIVIYIDNKLVLSESKE